jgi:hypothetical protein
LKGYLDPALLPQVQAHRACFLVGGKNRAGQLYRTHRTLKQLVANLFIGFDLGEGACE